MQSTWIIEYQNNRNIVKHCISVEEYAYKFRIDFFLKIKIIYLLNVGRFK